MLERVPDYRSFDVFIIHDTHAIIPALRQAQDKLTYGQAGIQQDKKAFCLNQLDSRFRGNDVAVSRIDSVL